MAPATRQPIPPLVRMPVTWPPHAGPARAGAILAMLALLACVLGAPARAQAEDTGHDPLFRGAEVLPLTLEGPLRAIAADRAAKPAERPVRLRWAEPDGSLRELEIEVRARGRSRRDPARCAFPPLRLDLPRSRVAGTLFAEQDKLKLVSHCRPLGSRASGARDWVLLEYFAYRILGRLTEAAFAVRLLDVTWIDETGDEFRHPAFLIEAQPRLAARLELEPARLHDVEAAALDPGAAQLAELFQYAIGNTDFSFTRAAAGEDVCCHNAILLGDDGGEPFVPVPYDFDVTGLVDPPGAIPAAGLGVRRVTERVWLGPCRSPDRLAEAVERFRADRPGIEAELAALPGLSDFERSRVGAFLEAFFVELESPGALAARACSDAGP